jgi:hypothetical protein
MLQDDLNEARRRWLQDAKTDAERAERERADFLKHIDADGRVLDFHGTRHTYISGIVAGGASVKTCQELARHSTPTLTIGRYSHARLHDLTAALDALPECAAPGNDGNAPGDGSDGNGKIYFLGGVPGALPALIKSPNVAPVTDFSPSAFFITSWM